MKKGILSYALLTIGGLGVLAGISGAVLAIERNANSLKNTSSASSVTSSVTSSASSSEATSTESTSSEAPIPEEKTIAIIGLSDLYCTEAEDDNDAIYMSFSLESIGLKLDECTATITIPEGCRVVNQNYNVDMSESGTIDPSIQKFSLVCPKPDDDGEESLTLSISVNDGKDTFSDSTSFKIYGKNATPAYSLSLKFDTFEVTAENGTDMCLVPFKVDTSISDINPYEVSYNLLGYDDHIVNYCFITDEDGKTYEGPKGTLPHRGNYVLHLEKLAYNNFYIYSMHASIAYGSQTIETQAKFCANGATATISDSISALGFAPSGTKRLIQSDTAVSNVADYYAFGRTDRSTCPLILQVLNFDGTVSSDVTMTTDDFGSSNEQLTVVSGTKVHFDFPAQQVEEVQYYYLSAQYDCTYLGTDVDANKTLVCCSGIEASAERIDGLPEGDTIENTDGSDVEFDITPFFRFSKFAPEDMELGVSVTNSFTTSKIQFNGSGKYSTIDPVYCNRSYHVILGGLKPGVSGTIKIFLRKKYGSTYVNKTYTYFRVAPTTLIYDEPTDVFGGSSATTKSYTFAMPESYDSTKTKIAATLTNLKTNEVQALPLTVGSTTHSDGLATGLSNQTAIKLTYPIINVGDYYEVHVLTYYNDTEENIENDYKFYYSRRGSSDYEGIYNPITEISDAVVGEDYYIDFYYYINCSTQTVFFDLYDVDDKSSTSFHFKEEKLGKESDGTRLILGNGLAQGVYKISITIPAQDAACSKTFRFLARDGYSEVISGTYADFNIAYTCSESSSEE